jgi:hypothetical protein
LWELAPLLVLCEDSPTEATLRREIQLIRDSPLAETEQTDLLAIAIRVAGRRFPRPLFETVLRRELPMVQGATIIDDWIAEGEARGEARGREAEARRILRLVMESRFGAIPASLETQIASASADWCERLLSSALKAAPIDELLPGISGIA